MNTGRKSITRPRLDFGVPEGRTVEIGPLERGAAAALKQYGVFLDGERIGFVASIFDVVDSKRIHIWLGSDGHTKKGLRQRNEAAYRLVASHLDSANVRSGRG